MYLKIKGIVILLIKQSACTNIESRKIENSISSQPNSIEKICLKK